MGWLTFNQQVEFQLVGHRVVVRFCQAGGSSRLANENGAGARLSGAPPMNTASAEAILSITVFRSLGVPCNDRTSDPHSRCCGGAHPM